jgi:sugar lactone lactonase YvrE
VWVPEDDCLLFSDIPRSRIQRWRPGWTAAEVYRADSGCANVSAKEFAESTPEETEWLVEGLVPRGGMVELDGKIKSSGKTTFSLAMCRAILDGTDFLGFPTTSTPS